MTVSSSPAEAGGARLPRVIGLMAGAAGLVGANVHYSQPLLPLIALALSSSPTVLGALPAVTQAGFAISLLAVLPLADSLDRKRLLLLTTAVAAVALVGEALAPNLPILLIAAFVAGAASVAPQVLSPFAASLAPPGREGQASGMVLSGILLGVLLSKVLSGIVGAELGWRWMFGIASIAMVVVIVVLARALPSTRTVNGRVRFVELLGSPVALLRRHTALRLHAVLGALASAAFMLFWSSYALHLYDQFGFGSLIAGLFGIAGIAGSLLAPVAGRAVDRGRAVLTLGLSAGLIVLAFAIMLGLQSSVIGLIIGIVILDGGVGIAHSTNQARVLRLDPARRSRLNSVYMFSYFLGGAVGSIVAVSAYAAEGWLGVCVSGAIAGIAALIVAFVNRRLVMQPDLASGEEP